MTRLVLLFLCFCTSVRAQEPLTLAAITLDRSLWPSEVMVTVDHKVPVIIDDKVAKTLKFGPGKTYRVKEITAKGVSVASLGSPLIFGTDETDVVARAENIRAQKVATTQASPASGPAVGEQGPAGSLQGAELFQGPLPYTMGVPAGFRGPLYFTNGNSKNFVYVKTDFETKGMTAIQISIEEISPEDVDLSVDEQIKKSVELTMEETGATITTEDIVDSMLSGTTARQISYKSVVADRPPAVAVSQVYSDGKKIYAATIACAEELAPETLPELRMAVDTLKFRDERYIGISGSAYRPTPKILCAAATPRPATAAKKPQPTPAPERVSQCPRVTTIRTCRRVAR